MFQKNIYFYCIDYDKACDSGHPLPLASLLVLNLSHSQLCADIKLDQILKQAIGFLNSQVFNHFGSSHLTRDIGMGVIL